MDLIISGSNCHISCDCTQWSVDDDNIKISTFMSKTDIQYLEDSTTPGAVSQSHNILGKNYYYDSTWDGSNTLVIIPQSSDGNLDNMRDEETAFVKHLTSEPIKGNSQYLDVNLECIISES